MNIKSMRVRSYRSFVVDEYVPAEATERYRTLKVTPAIEAGVDDAVRDCKWIVGLIDARAPKPKPRGPYNTRPLQKAALTKSGPRIQTDTLPKSASD